MTLLLFPEGTRSRTGDLGRFHRGAAKLALAAQVPVVPVYLDGVYGLLPPGRFVPRLFGSGLSRYTLTAFFGRPIATSGLEANADNEESLTVELEAAVRRLGGAKADRPNVSSPKG